jgi:hypothetical protein
MGCLDFLSNATINMVKTPSNEVLHTNGPKIRIQRSILPNFQLKYACCDQNFEKKLKKFKKGRF